MNITGSNVTIVVKNMEESITFYQQIGLKLKQRKGDFYAMLAAADVAVGLYQSDGSSEPSSGTVSIGFTIDNVAAAEDLLSKHQIMYKLEDYKSGTYLHFYDPSGTRLYYVLPKWETDHAGH